ncbi:large ribosomal subunit protein uL23m [Gadus morhua]|uniref:Large ribosomal subunit protein uL23m n=1 Tax=Gadus morhua TaxID=8049 RepID=A0A8C4ZVI5_GADMO|nr:39S ribosomal protein L23, mitochondrial-like [Gadus morhua]
MRLRTRCTRKHFNAHGSYQLDLQNNLNTRIPTSTAAMAAKKLIYPLYQLGNPQLRLFRPNWALTLVRPGREQPSDTVQFRIPMEMTKCDVKNYLEKAYSVPVGAVRTRIQFGSNKKRNHLNQKVKQPDYKVAYVQLAQDQVFVFPDIFVEKSSEEGEGSMEQMQKQFMEDEKQRQRGDPRRAGVTEWFGL